MMKEVVVQEDTVAVLPPVRRYAVVAGDGGTS
jgi:hypothetical protein